MQLVATELDRRGLEWTVEKGGREPHQALGRSGGTVSGGDSGRS